MNSPREKHLKDILRCEAKEAEWGAKAAKSRREYAENYSNIKAGDKVILYLKTGEVAYGISGAPRFATNHGFYYQINPSNSTFDKPTKRKAYYHFYNRPNGRPTEVLRIEKAR